MGERVRVAMAGFPTYCRRPWIGPPHRHRRPAFPAGFFDRYDDEPDGTFYEPLRLVTHIDDGAIAAVGRLYTELGLTGARARPDVVVGVALRASRPTR